jgi:hypothetical protein
MHCPRWALHPCIARAGSHMPPQGSRNIQDTSAQALSAQSPPSQRSLHNAPIFRLLLKVAVNGTHQCDCRNFCGGLGPQQEEHPSRASERGATRASNPSEMLDPTGASCRPDHLCLASQAAPHPRHSAVGRVEPSWGASCRAFLPSTPGRPRPRPSAIGPTPSCAEKSVSVNVAVFSVSARTVSPTPWRCGMRVLGGLG